MGIQSVDKTGVSICVPKPRASTFVHQDSQIMCFFADPSSNGFFALGQDMAKNGNVKFYDVASSINNGPAPVSSRAFIVVADSAAYIDATRPVWSFNKESLTSLLEFADGAGCQSLYACVKKDAPMFADIMRSYSANGFSIVPPSNSAGDNCVKLVFAI